MKLNYVIQVKQKEKWYAFAENSSGSTNFYKIIKDYEEFFKKRGAEIYSINFFESYKRCNEVVERLNEDYKYNLCLIALEDLWI